MKESHRKHIPKGIVFVITSGEYSDYSFNECLVSLTEITLEMQDIAANELRERFLVEGKEEWEMGSDLRETWPTELVRRGWAVPLTYVEIWVGAYSGLEIGTKRDGE